MKVTRLLRHAAHGPWGDSARHLPLDVLEEEMRKLSPPKDQGNLGLIVSRRDDGTRDTPERARLTAAGGVPGDAWLRDAPDKIDAQITLMRSDVARLIANGQELTLFGDNLLVDLDLSRANLPAGSRLSLGPGGAILEVTPEPHDGCLKFHRRFGKDALRITASPAWRDQRLRGIYVKVVSDGEVALGDSLQVLERGPASA